MGMILAAQYIGAGRAILSNLLPFIIGAGAAEPDKAQWLAYDNLQEVC